MTASTDTTPRGPRARGRELAVLVLCHVERFEPGTEDEARALLWASPPVGDAPGEDAFAVLVADGAAREMADALVDAWVARRDEVDAAIEASSQRWRLSRMDRVDRNVLRLATAELLGDLGTPPGVVLSEAVRIARRYGSDKSPTFVNGLLDAIAERSASQVPAT
jgi:N utilization substance protein B